MAKQTFSEKLMSAQLMNAGISKNLSTLSTVGMTEATTEAMKTMTDEAIALNDEQESLKAQLKMKTEELDAKMAVLDEEVARCRKLVKVVIPQAQWREFGIEAKV